jgi:hypothetical protein
MPDFSAAIILLEKPLEELCAQATGPLLAKLKFLRAQSRMKALHQRLYESQRVKTIWHTDRPLSLSSFFHPAYVMRSESGVASQTKLTSLNDLPDNHNILFGTVGQGKSILIRYLLGKEIKSGTRIPVLCELRNVDKDTLEEYLTDRLALLLDVSPDQDLFSAFAGKGKLSFLLDGYDEIEPSRLHSLTQNIQDLSFKYPECRIVLTSRPDAECKHLTNFHINRLAPISERELPEFYKRITKDQAFTQRIVAAIGASPMKIRGLLTTPLLATLLAISYRAAHKIPLDFAEFYDELFQILLVRHDGAKLGWRRQRQTKLNDRQIQQIFEAFCFATRKRQLASVDHELAQNLAAEAVKICDQVADPQLFLKDIKNITCLIIDEGKKMNFVHISVQEFFAARYIRTRADGVAMSFYEQLLAGKWDKWQEELLFLQQVDSYRSAKYFFIPDLTRTVQDLQSVSAESPKDEAAAYLSGLVLNKAVAQRDGKDVPHYYIARVRKKHTHRYFALDSAIFKRLFSNHVQGAKAWNSGFSDDLVPATKTYLQVAKDRGDAFADELTQFAAGLISLAKSDLNSMKDAISREDAMTSFVDI